MGQIILARSILENAIDSGLECIKNNPRGAVKNVSRTLQALNRLNIESSGCVRWLIEHKRTDHWETDRSFFDTARAATALGEYGIIFPGVKRWLLCQQSVDGSWNDDVTETAYALIALADMDEKNERGCKWLRNHTGLVKGASGTTALVITALYKQGFGDELFISGKVALLKQVQLDSGSWKSLAITNIVAQALFAVGERASAFKAVSWLLSQQRKDGGWGSDTNDTTPLTLITLEMALNAL